MPLLLDFKVYADDPANGLARGVNQFHIGYIGVCWSGAPGAFGYYPGTNGTNSGPQGFLLACGSNWPVTRVHTSGGLDGLNNQREVFVIDPANEEVASGGWIFDPGLGDTTNGLVFHPGQDDHVQWAKADFVRRVSVVTTGFFDTLQPNKHALTAADTLWPGTANPGGLPDLATLGATRGVVYRPSDMVAIVDPPLQTAPVGTSMSLELRGVDSFDNSDVIYDSTTMDRFDMRGNLLNPNYACEAYRYAMPNSTLTKNLPRVDATGLTPYVQPDDLDTIRASDGLLPRFFNMRLVFENDIGPDPVEAPSIRSIGIAYRLTSR